MTAHALRLPGAALVAVIALLGIQVALGGGDFVPTASADPCVPRAAGAPTTDVDKVSQEVLLGGVQDAACALGVPREQLLLALPSSKDRLALADRLGKSDDELLAAVKAGMLRTVGRLADAGSLPKSSALVEQFAGDLGLTGLAAEAVKSVPADMVDRLLPSRDVLEGAIERLDLGKLLDQADDPDAWEPAVRDAIRDAAIEQVRTKISETLSSGLGGLFGG